MEAVVPTVPQGFLSTGLADSGVIRRAWLVAALSAAVFCFTVPFAATPLVPFPAFVPIYVSTLVLCDIITAVLLFSQFSVLRSRSLLILAGGYLFTCSSTLGYFLIFPGMLAPTGLFGAGPQTSSAMYMFWHGGFPLFVMGYGGMRAREAGGAVAPFAGRPWKIIGVLSVVILALAAAYTAFAALGNAWIPEFLVGNRTTALGHWVLLAIWALNLAALLMLWTQRNRTMLDVWLMVMMAVWLCDLGLSAILNTGRYDLGWYVGRMNGLVAAGFLLVLLLIEGSQSYSRLFRLSIELEKANATLHELSIRDGLTGLVNRRSFDQTLEDQITIAQRHGRNLALVLCDIDSFKAYNDHYGHLSGDETLKQVAACLAACCRRGGDLAARYGGEEFALILPDTDLAAASSLAEAARESVLKEKIPHVKSAVSALVSISAGVASFSAEHARTAVELIDLADKALYRAKQGGRNRVETATFPLSFRS